MAARSHGFGQESSDKTELLVKGQVAVAVPIEPHKTTTNPIEAHRRSNTKRRRGSVIASPADGGGQEAGHFSPFFPMIPEISTSVRRSL